MGREERTSKKKMNTKRGRAYVDRWSEKYQKENKYSKSQADIAARRRLRTKRILQGIGIAAGAAAVAKVGYEIYNHNMDRTIKEGQSFMRFIANDSKGSLHDQFYSVKNKRDKHIYEGLFARHLEKKGKAIDRLDLRAKKEIKIASPKNAQKMFEDFLKSDPEYSKDPRIKSILNGNKKEIKKLYEGFNQGMVARNDSATKFREYVKSRGYDGIQDVNDRKFSGFKATNPMIIFAKDKVSIVKRTPVSHVKAKKAREIGRFAIRGYLPYISALAALKAVDTNNKHHDIYKYRSEHPDTKLTDKEILKKTKSE